MRDITTMSNIYHEIILENIKVGKDIEQFKRFFEELSEYQSNHYGAYDSQPLRDEYFKLPEDFRKVMSISRYKYGNCFRGDDDKNEKPVSSFVYHENPEIAKRNALFYGHYAFSLKSDVKSFSGIMSTDFNKYSKYFGKKLTYKILDEYSIGDSENEVLIFDIRFK
jgi:hypothetical protein